MHFRSTLILCALAIVGVLAAMITERVRPSSTDRASSETTPLFLSGQLPVDRVERITLRRDNGSSFLFERTGDRWEQVEPFDYPMDAYSISQLMTLAAEVTVIEQIDPDRLEESVSLKTLGLDPPRAELTLEWSDGFAQLALGRRGIAGRAYLAVDGREPVFVVNQDLHDRAVDMDVKEWRDRRIFHDAGVDSDRIEIVSGEAEMVLVRDRKQWKMTAPAATRVDALACDELFNALGRATVGGFMLDESADLARFGLAEPAGVLTVQTTAVGDEGGGSVPATTTQRLLIGAGIGMGSGDRFGLVEGRPVIVRITEPVLVALFRQPRDLVAATATGVVPADVKSIRINGPDGDFLIQRDLERWIAPDHAGQEVPYQLVDELLRALTEVRATEFELRPYPREMHVATITLFAYGERPLDSVRVAREPEKDGQPGRWAMENGDNVLRIYPPGFEPKLAPRDYGLAGDAP